MQYQNKFMSIAAVAGVFALVAAQVGAGANGEQRVYQLASINGQPLPVVTEAEDDCQEEVTEATLTLHDSGEWLLEVSQRESCGDAVEEEVEEEEGTYTTEGNTVRFSEDDAEDDADDPEDDADEAEDDADEAGDTELDLEDLAVGTVGADGLSVRLADGETVVLFRR